MVQVTRRLLLALLALSLLALGAVLVRQPREAAASPQFSGGYPYLHFASGNCQGLGKEGREVIDTRNGNMWCVPIDGSAAMSMGTLNLGAIPEKAPKN